MSWKINKNGDITMTRGDTPQFIVNINIQGEDGALYSYEPLETDEIVFALSKSETNPQIILTKVIPNDSKVLRFEEEDTKQLEFGTYFYEISLNSNTYHCTFITGKKIKITTEIY